MTRTFRLPWPPSVNGAWGHRNSRKYHTPRGRQFREESADDIRRQLGDTPPIMGRVAVLLELTAPDKRKRDIDNHAKAVLDAIEAAGVLANDEQVDELRIVRRGVEPPGCCDVVITEL